ncbi:hypothetical protein SAMN05421642_10734 [Rhodococcoides kyotonense]|uniref:Uncharacterized protein n=1 Tax=Rhodococcoides kyotonense TaxID=398843 RepID=A0A239IFF6_9NOCA|nr:hypothetical protein SAMN05421642_10734 [Rhodococcus kyotonensis]
MGAGYGDELDPAGFDATLADAWHRFESNLAVHVATMPEGTYITITSAQASHGQRGQRPYVDLVAVDAERMVCVAALPSYLYPEDPDRISFDRRLHGLGWSEPGKPTVDGTVMDYTLDGVRDEADLLATVAVATFREVWNVPHPSFLSAWTVGPGESGSGPVALAHVTVDERPRSVTPRTSTPSADSLPTELRSLHTFCELIGHRVDAATVLSVCGSADLGELRVIARAHARDCAEHADRCRTAGSEISSRVWRRQARSWLHTADSLRAGGDTRPSEPESGARPSGPDSAAKSAGS